MTVHVAGRAWRLPDVRWQRLGAYDWVMILGVAAVVAIGIAMLYSATLRGGQTVRAWDDLVLKQSVFALIGALVLGLAAITEYRVVLALWKWIYLGTIALLLALPLFGTLLGGSQRWFSAGLVLLQPSELAKVALIVCLAAYFEGHDAREWKTIMGSAVLVGVPMVLVMQQPDLSTAVMLGAIWVGMLFASGVRPLHLSLLALAAAPLAMIVLAAGVIKPYQLMRITALLDPDVAPLREGYQNIQTLLAVGNGGLTGTGYAGGLQSQGGWLPLVYTDNIYALVAEELGYIGGVALLGLLALVVWRVLRAAGLAQDKAGYLIAVGVASYLLAQTFVNVGVVLQLIPVTGLALPFVSYGGSSLVSLMAAIGLVQSVIARRRPLEFR
ncbi:MAG: FtsW/RodA/SpoVE family cell cycle protein [Anaerolineae bacterium]|jgi:rod shape determining protein RodA